MNRYSCPACSRTLHIARHEGTRYWRCPGCGGFLVSLAVIRKRIAEATFNSLWQLARSGDVMGWRSCAGCHKNMRLVEVGSNEEPIELDVCESCQLIWFDSEELESLEQQGTVEQSEKLDNDEQASDALRRYHAIQEARNLEVNVGLSRTDPGTAKLVTWSQSVPEKPPIWSNRVAAFFLCTLILMASGYSGVSQSLSHLGSFTAPGIWLIVATAFAGPHMGAAIMVSAVLIISAPIVEMFAGSLRTLIVFVASHGMGLVVMSFFLEQPVMGFYGAMGGATGLACAAWWGWGEASHFSGKDLSEAFPWVPGLARNSEIPKRPYRRVVYTRGRAVRVDPPVNPAIVRLIFAPSLVFVLTQWNMKSFVFAMEPFQMSGFMAYLMAVAGSGWAMGLMWVARQQK